MSGCSLPQAPPAAQPLRRVTRQPERVLRMPWAWAIASEPPRGRVMPSAD